MMNDEPQGFFTSVGKSYESIVAELLKNFKKYGHWFLSGEHPKYLLLDPTKW